MRLIYGTELAFLTITKKANCTRSNPKVPWFEVIWSPSDWGRRACELSNANQDRVRDSVPQHDDILCP